LSHTRLTHHLLNSSTDIFVAVWGNGGRADGYARSGSTPGTSTYAESANGLDWAITVNTRDWAPYTTADDPFTTFINNAVAPFLGNNPTV